jgi:integrase/recombinase XerD
MKKQYVFNDEINSKLDEFKNYLQTENYAKESIRIKSNYAGVFLQFLENENLKAAEIKYPGMLAFIEILSEENKSKKLINNILLSTRNYYEFLNKTDNSIKNPAQNLYIKGTVRKLPENIIKFETLEEIYKKYKTVNNRTKRNKIILGLLIYQGITTEELHKLKPEHIILKKAQIYIPGNKKRNSRKLDLQGFQIMELQEYLQKTRALIIKEINKKRPARKPDKIDKEKINRQLFISINGSINLKNSLLHLFKEIQKTYSQLSNAKQIRRSVIVHKLKTMNLREVQYFAGHKYVSSTERYLLNNIEDLKRQTEKYHPLREL